MRLQEQRHGDCHSLLQFHKAVIRYQAGKISLIMSANKTKVKVLEAGKMSAMKGYQNGVLFAVRKRCFTVSDLMVTCIKPVSDYFGIKFFAEIIDTNENFNNLEGVSKIVVL